MTTLIDDALFQFQTAKNFVAMAQNEERKYAYDEQKHFIAMAFMHAQTAMVMAQIGGAGTLTIDAADYKSCCYNTLEMLLDGYNLREALPEMDKHKTVVQKKINE